MARDDSSKVEAGGFIKYDKAQLAKIDSMRRDKSQPDFFGVPILSDAQVLFTTAAELGDKPASCYTCKEQTADFTCERLGPGVLVKKVVGSRKSGEPIEYWPCCSMHEYTDAPRQGKVSYHDDLDTPDSLGLIWINAPKPGLSYSGANCGGVKGGDDCDHYLVRGKTEKWDADSGFCRVLQHDVKGGDVCAAWHDDDELHFEEAQRLLKGDSLDTIEKTRLARSILGRDR